MVLHMIAWGVGFVFALLGFAATLHDLLKGGNRR